jgi:hypothetical protein
VIMRSCYIYVPMLTFLLAPKLLASPVPTPVPTIPRGARKAAGDPTEFLFRQAFYALDRLGHKLRNSIRPKDRRPPALVLPAVVETNPNGGKTEIYREIGRKAEKEKSTQPQIQQPFLLAPPKNTFRNPNPDTPKKEEQEHTPELEQQSEA